MNAKRVYLILLGLSAVIVIAIIGTAAGVNAVLKKDATTLANAKAKNAALSSQQTGLAAAKREIAKYAGLEKITASIVPQDKDQAEAVREITNIAGNSGVTLTTVSFSASTLGALTPAAASASKSALSQLTPVVGIQGVYDLQITIANNANNSVSYDQLDAFLQGLEHNRRTAQVSSVTITPSPLDANRLTFTLIVNDYIRPS